MTRSARSSEIVGFLGPNAGFTVKKVHLGISFEYSAMEVTGDASDDGKTYTGVDWSRP